MHTHACTYDDGEYRIYTYMYTNCGTGTETNVPRTSLPCSPRYGNPTRTWFEEALGAKHLLVHYRSGGGSTGHAASAITTSIPYYLTRETDTRIHPYNAEQTLYGVRTRVEFGSFPPATYVPYVGHGENARICTTHRTLCLHFKLQTVPHYKYSTAPRYIT